ncbi:MAG: hypothetical protein U0804_10745 [Gemmataceae bacterium]
MSNATLGLLVGGLVPAVCFGLSGAVQKGAAGGIATGPYLVVIGLVVAAAGAAVTAVERDATATPAGAGYAALFGLLWAAGVGAIAVALGRFEARISQLVPLYNMNTLVAVAVGLVALGEWQTVQPGRLALAAALVVAGGVLAATAGR